MASPESSKWRCRLYTADLVKRRSAAKFKDTGGITSKGFGTHPLPDVEARELLADIGVPDWPHVEALGVQTGYAFRVPTVELLRLLDVPVSTPPEDPWSCLMSGRIYFRNHLLSRRTYGGLGFRDEAGRCSPTPG